MQAAAEARLGAIEEAAWLLEGDPDDPELQDVVGLWCGGCETCVVREVLNTAVPILLEAIRTGEITP